MEFGKRRDGEEDVVARTIYLIVGRSVGRSIGRLADFRGKSGPEEVDSPIIRSKEWSIGGGRREGIRVGLGSQRAAASEKRPVLHHYQRFQLFKDDIGGQVRVPAVVREIHRVKFVLATYLGENARR